MARTKSVHVWMDPEEYQRLEDIARRRKESVSELIRKAVKERYLLEGPNKNEAVQRILQVEIDLPEWDVLEKEITEREVGEGRNGLLS